MKIKDKADHNTMEYKITFPLRKIKVESKLATIYIAPLKLV